MRWSWDPEGGRFDSRWNFAKTMQSTSCLSKWGNGGSKESTNGSASPQSAGVGVWQLHWPQQDVAQQVWNFRVQEKEIMVVSRPLAQNHTVAPLRFWGTETESSATTLIYWKTVAENLSYVILCKCSPFSGFSPLSFWIVPIFTPERWEMGEKTLTSVNACTKSLTCRRMNAPCLAQELGCLFWEGGASLRGCTQLCSHDWHHPHPFLIWHG